MRSLVESFFFFEGLRTYVTHPQVGHASFLRYLSGSLLLLFLGRSAQMCDSATIVTCLIHALFSWVLGCFFVRGYEHALLAHKCDVPHWPAVFFIHRHFENCFLRGCEHMWPTHKCDMPQWSAVFFSHRHGVFFGKGMQKCVTHSYVTCFIKVLSSWVIFIFFLNGGEHVWLHSMCDMSNLSAVFFSHCRRFFFSPLAGVQTYVTDL